MDVTAERLELGPDEFAFHFETKSGVDADALAGFLMRAATVARRRGSELRVVGMREGSLAVVIKAIKKSKVAKGAANEFYEKPIDTTVKVTGFVAGIAWAIAQAMSPSEAGSTPIAKAGAEVVEKHGVTEIALITNETNTVIMNSTIASEVRRLEEMRAPMLGGPTEIRQLPGKVTALVEDAMRGSLTGEVAIIGRELHFRPDGYKYWVPVEADNSIAKLSMSPGGHFRVAGRIVTRDNQPDRIIVNDANPMDQ